MVSDTDAAVKATALAPCLKKGKRIAHGPKKDTHKDHNTHTKISQQTFE
jgi:hypothetical protein